MVEFLSSLKSRNLLNYKRAYTPAGFVISFYIYVYAVNREYIGIGCIDRFARPINGINIYMRIYRIEDSIYTTSRRCVCVFLESTGII